MGLTFNIPKSKRQQAKAVKDDFDTIRPAVSAFYTDSTNTVGLTHGQIATELTSWNAAPASLAELTSNVNSLAAMVGLLTVIVSWLVAIELAKRN